MEREREGEGGGKQARKCGFSKKEQETRNVSVCVSACMTMMPNRTAAVSSGKGAPSCAKIIPWSQILPARERISEKSHSRMWDIGFLLCSARWVAVQPQRLRRVAPGVHRLVSSAA